jgi:uncharacterized protein (TIGR03067 family)
VNRLTTTVVVMLAELAPAAPRLKDPPKQTPPIVGKWRLVSIFGQKPASGWTMEYFADGRAVRTNDNNSPEFWCRYNSDTSTDPARLDYLHDYRPPGLCIFKVEGDTLTVCYLESDRKERPKAFGEPSILEQVFKRVKPQD